MATPGPARAAEPPAEGEGLAPRLTTVTQTLQQLEAGNLSRLGVQAEDPQGSPLTFSWNATSGTLSRPLGNANTSRVSWTAPRCLARSGAPVSVTVTNGLGLSTTAPFDFSLVQDLKANHQPLLTADSFEQFQGVTFQEAVLTVKPQAPESVEHIVFPEDRPLSVTLVSSNPGASHSFGYLYVDELQQRGYVNAQGELVDANANGITDLHEDLYNLAPPSGAKARPYIGWGSRCNRTFISEGLTFSIPDLTLSENCSGGFAAQQDLDDARPGPNFGLRVDVVGSAPLNTPPTTAYSDFGLFPRIPNLLEPAHDANHQMGLGRLVFLLTDDDDDQKTYLGMGAVADKGSWDSEPDYDVSAYAARGILSASNPDPGISFRDRTVDLGIIPGGRELVFFLVVSAEAKHIPDNDNVYPCLRKAGNGQCTLHLKTPLSVFFSKAKWNLDQDSLGLLPTVTRSAQCEYSDGCNPVRPMSGACNTRVNGGKACGWLRGDTLDRLRHIRGGDATILTPAAVSVTYPDNGNLPHALLHAPPSTPGRWLLSFEDSNGGGVLQDFNDVVFQFQSPPVPGAVRSRVVNPEQMKSPEEEGCAISRVRFLAHPGGAYGCHFPETFPSYAVATDCRMCDRGVCQSNPTPTWHPVLLEANSRYEVVMDVSHTPGTQLCWKAELPAIDGTCHQSPVYMEVGYEYGPVGP
ncbi:hypothetical protein D7W81_39825 [Corallococcus aberystwythensis]|uniref:DUF4114 domain-containing protein n=2 Tax=Corallococcus aberystwythensis TaxID=2316722 RepID=A0A3A8P9C0_9BACT|nr:hypothetical protein D7W81_39825 [Corallococcus aberystwythensis]